MAFRQAAGEGWGAEGLSGGVPAGCRRGAWPSGRLLERGGAPAVAGEGNCGRLRALRGAVQTFQAGCRANSCQAAGGLGADEFSNPHSFYPRLELPLFRKCLSFL